MNRFRTLRWPAVGAALCVVAAACGGNADADTTPTTTVTTTTVAPTTTAPDVGPLAPLTGLPVEDPAVLERPAILVKIDNSDMGTCEFQARPQAGVDVADLILEMEVEGGITRLAAVFHSTPPEVIGPVRSARSSDLDIITAFNVPLLAFSGSNVNVAAELRRIGDRYIDVGHSSAAGRLFYRDRSRCAPANLFVEPADLYQFAGDQGNPPAPVLVFRDLDDPAERGGEPAAGVRFTRGNEVVYTWNRATRSWDRLQRGTPHVAAEGGQMSPTNVVLLETQYRGSSTGGSPQAVTVGEGRAVVYLDGRVLEGTWSRPAPDAPWEIVDADGEVIELAPGRTVVHLARAGTFETLDAASAARFIE